jgi:hypothetical protein
LRQHHSFIKLPDSGYQRRRHDPRVGCFTAGYSDFGVPIDQPLEQRFITRHRLEKRDATAKVSLPKQPIVYYVDPGVPQPVRDALVDGALWWTKAFESAGFTDAFQVRILPKEADPMDVRYNVIQWVHRAWTCATTSFNGCIEQLVDGRTVNQSLTRALARSSKVTSS